MTEIEKIIEKEFDKRKYVLATRKIYKTKLLELFEFYDQFEPKDITFIQIDSFLFKKNALNLHQVSKIPFGLLKCFLMRF